ncbi:cyclopropane-fatty-acyl-phospholipid synthase family protein [Streptomyces sp. NBC_00847]|uniref:SAM-dependent methyltransferase n=1 Tax=Streptomyces sp. NBC_00847 TaxID=2975850 RepID=UPI0022545FBE|nr:class I SAM-dependent methyltransferase [Streptomyces sp. NBC_00847]MCX4880362.1 class I SAM-dependent methyltransferase [Streptomyces sp. NBC_00847]
MSDTSKNDVAESLFGAFAGIHALSLPRTTVSPPFEGLLGAFYTKLVTQSGQDSEWFVRHAPRTAETVLDLCCGGGRTAVAFARSGRRVTAVDRSALQIAAAGKHAAEEGVAGQVEWLTTDVTGLDLGRTFDLIVIAGLSLTLFEEDARAAFLDVVRRHLAPGGRLLLDHTPALLDEPSTEQALTLPVSLGDRHGFVLLGAQRIPAEGRQFTNMYAEIVDSEGGTERHLTGFRFRVDSSNDLALELTNYGLVVRDSHPDPHAVSSPGPTPFALRELVVAEASA